MVRYASVYESRCAPRDNRRVLLSFSGARRSVRSWHDYNVPARTLFDLGIVNDYFEGLNEGRRSGQGEHEALLSSLTFERRMRRGARAARKIGG